MATNRLNLVYAIKDGAGISIEDVDSGLKCGCVCPACGEPLVAKKEPRLCTISPIIREAPANMAMKRLFILWRKISYRGPKKLQFQRSM